MSKPNGAIWGDFGPTWALRDFGVDFGENLDCSPSKEVFEIKMH